VAEANLVIGVEAVGAQEASAQLDTLATAENSVTQAAERQLTVTNQTAAATEKATAASRRAAGAASRQATAASSLASAAQNVAATQARATEASNRFGLSLPRVSDESRKAGMGMAMMFNEGTEMVFMLSSAFPALRQVSILFASAGNSAFGLARALGPIGVAVAAAAAAIPALISLLSDTSEEMDDTAASTDRATRSLQDFIAAQRTAMRAEQQLARVRAGGGTAEEQAGLAAMVGEEVGEAEARLERVGRAAGVNQQAMARIAEVAREAAAQGRDVSQAVTQQIQFAAATGAITQSEQAQNNIRYAATALANIQRDFDVQQRRAREFREDVRQQQQEEIEFELAAEQDPDRFGAGRRRGGGGGGGGREDTEQAERERVQAEFERLSAISQMQNDLRAKRERFQDAEAARLVEAKELEIEIQDAIITKLEEREEREKALAAAAQERYAEQQDQLRQLGADFGDAFEGGVDRTIAAFERLNLALGKAGEETIDRSELTTQAIKAAWYDTALTTGEGAREAFSAAITAATSGEKTLKDAIKAQTHEFIRGIVLRSTVAAVEQGAAALAAAAIGNFPAAAAHGAAAAQYAAVAGVASAVGFGAGTFAPKKKKEEEPKEPKKNRERKEQQTLVINVGTFPVSTDADVGRAVQQALQAVERRDGR